MSRRLCNSIKKITLSSLIYAILFMCSSALCIVMYDMIHYRFTRIIYIIITCA